MGALKTAIARDFKGGLNTFDSPLNLSTRFITQANNVYPDSNGRLRLRYGLSRIAAYTTSFSRAVGMTYFNGRLIVVGINGKIISVTGAGAVTEIWNNTIAAALSGSPAGWSSCAFASFTQFGGKLIICNGIDKPVVCTAAFAVSYLVDAASGSNTNVPRAKYCCTHNNYLVLAVTPTDQVTLYIGHKGAAGTFVGDAPPNDAVNFNTTSYITEGPLEITGLATFRERLIVTFRGISIAVKLGTYDDSTTPVHIPAVEDVIESHGSVSHTTNVVLGDDMLIMDTTGVSSIQRALITNSLSPQRISSLIARDFQASIASYSNAALASGAFAVHDRIQQHVFFITPNLYTFTDDTFFTDGTLFSDSQNNAFVYCYDIQARFKCWTRFTLPAVEVGCRTEEGRVFFAGGDWAYYYHNQYEPQYYDETDEGVAIGLRTRFSDATRFSDTTMFADTHPRAPIPFTFETPYSDMRMPGTVKLSRMMSVTAEGNAAITVDMFTDRFTTPTLTLSIEQTLDPNDALQRPANNAREYAWPAKFERAKFRVTGEAVDEFNLVSIQMHYLEGNYRR